MQWPVAALLSAMLFLPGCGNNIRTKEKVEEAILERLKTHSGLDLNALDVTTTSVSFDNNMAYATVAFHPKGDSRLNGGMVITYTLENRGGKWVVKNVADSHGGSLASPPPPNTPQLPPGHPPVTSMNPPVGVDPHDPSQAR